MSEEIKPGFASEEVEEPVVPVPFPKTRMDRAHYAGVSEAQSVEVFQEEALCLHCMSSAVCKVADGVESSGALIVVSRCLAFLPRPE